MKIAGVFLLVLVASASAWPFSLFGDEEKKEEKSDVILNYDAGDHKHIQTGKPGEKVHGIFSVKEENGKVRTTSYRADKEGFNAEINEEDSSKHSEKQAEEKKPVDEKVIKEENKESLKKDEEKKDSLKKDEDKVKIGEKIKEEDKDNLEKEKDKVEKDSSKKKEEKDKFEKEEEKVEKDSTKKKDEKDWVKKDEKDWVKKDEKDWVKKDEKDWVKKDEEKNKVGEKVQVDEKIKEEKDKVDEKEVDEKDEDSDRKEAVKKGEFEELVKDKDVKGPLLGLISAALREEFKRSSHKPKNHANVQPRDYYPHVQYVPVSPYAAPYHGVRHRRAFFAPAYYY